jgi:prevent-host-death family protein
MLAKLASMKPVNIHDAKTNLSRLLRRVARGEEIVISRAGKPIARLAPLETGSRSPVLGIDAGRFVVPDDFDAPLPSDVLDSFEGRLESE